MFEASSFSCDSFAQLIHCEFALSHLGLDLVLVILEPSQCLFPQAGLAWRLLVSFCGCFIWCQHFGIGVWLAPVSLIPMTHRSGHPAEWAEMCGQTSADLAGFYFSSMLDGNGFVNVDLTPLHVSMCLCMREPFGRYLSYLFFFSLLMKCIICLCICFEMAYTCSFRNCNLDGHVAKYI